ncbi:unnamed protein product, partial [Amoebophrya sp. A120]
VGSTTSENIKASTTSTGDDGIFKNTLLSSLPEKIDLQNNNSTDIKVGTSSSSSTNTSTTLKKTGMKMLIPDKKSPLLVAATSTSTTTSKNTPRTTSNPAPKTNLKNLHVRPKRQFLTLDKILTLTDETHREACEQVGKTQQSLKSCIRRIF